MNIYGYFSHPKLYLKKNQAKLFIRWFAMDHNKRNLYLPAFGDLTGGYSFKSHLKIGYFSEEEIIEI